MLIHCIGTLQPNDKPRCVAYDKQEGFAVYAHTDGQHLAVDVGFVQPMSEVLRAKAIRRVVDRWASDRKTLIKHR